MHARTFQRFAAILAATVPLAALSALAPDSAVPDVSATCIFGFDCADQVPYCDGRSDCSIERGTEIVKRDINDIEKEDKASKYLQKVVVYLLGFLALVAVAYLLFSGFVVMTSSGDEEKVKKAKGTIRTVGLGLLLIFLAYAITNFFFRAVSAAEFVPSAHAEASVDQAVVGTFQEYRLKIEDLLVELDRSYKVDGRLKDGDLLKLKNLVNASMQTFADVYASENSLLANAVVTSIEVVRKDPGSDAKINDLSTALVNYFKKAKIPKIQGKAAATPSSGNAPLSVTFRVEEFRDPSGVVTPRGNYVWWMKTPTGRTTIGTGPSVMHTFKEERTYTVFLDVLSASRNSRGKTDVLPLQTSIDISVLPRLANVVLFANGQNISGADRHKVTPLTGRAGILLDATASQATGGAAIVKTSWVFGNGVARSYDGRPRLERQTYAGEGTYRVKLTLTTNEKQEVVKEFDLIVQDPMATIRADKTQGFAGEEFKFQANPNIGGTPLSYEWNVLEAESGKSLHASKLATTSYKFPRPGRYVVQLKTLSPNGKQDTDTLNIFVDSKNPVAAFDVRPTSAETPNSVILDATKTYDPDSLEASQLTFAWNIDGERVQLSDAQRSGAMGRYTFSTLGTHKIALEVTNEQGKTHSVRKDFEVTSLLSVKLSSTPKIAKVGTPVHFVAESKEANAFEWSFGDGTNDLSSEGRVSHSFLKSGTFDVRLTVRGGGSVGQNSITRKVYVTDADSPFALIGVKRDSDALFPTESACGDSDAYVVDRVGTVRFTAEESVNVDGTTNGLSYFWKYGSKTSTQRDFTYKFDEIGCFPVELTVRSQKTGKTSGMKTFVKVENVKPSLASIGIAAQKSDADPVVVEVTANNAADPDGVITSYLWYYYTDSDPEPQDFRITRSPKTTFVLPRINGKYYFAVTMEDSNGEKVNSEQEREERYSITLVSDNINTPLITLKADNTNVSAGKEVKFDAIVKNVLQQDVSDKAEYKWDFDGDGFYDESTKEPTVTHAYDVSGTYAMKVKVTYKGISNTKYQTITVKNDLKPSMEYFAVGRKFVFVNTTPGVYSKVRWSLSNGVTSTDVNTFSYEFADTDDLSTMVVRLEVSDGKSSKYVESNVRKDSINAARIAKSEDRLIVLSYPKAKDSVIEVTDPSDPVFLYLGESRGEIGKYLIDADVSRDSDLNGEAADDVDNKGTDSYLRGSAFALRDLSKGNRERKVRLAILDASGKEIESKEVTILLAYKSEETASGSTDAATPKDISESDKVGIERLKDLIRTKAPEQDRMKLMQYLSSLQENWFDSREKTKIVIDFQSFLSELDMDAASKDEMVSILDAFLVSDDQTNDEIALAVSVLKSLVPQSNPHYEEIVGTKDKPGLVDEILSHPTNVELNRELGKKILEYVKDDQNIENKDKVIIKSQLEVIIYGGQSNVPTANEGAGTAETDGSFFATLVSFALGFGKTVGILLLVIPVLLLLLFAYYKVANQNPAISFQDFIIEKLSGKTHSDSGSAPAPAAPAPAAPAPAAPAPVADPLANVAATAPARREEPIRETSVTAEAEKDSVEIPEAAESDSAPSEVPAWLRGSSLDTASAPVAESASSDETPQPAAAEALAASPEPAPASDLPDWLKGMEASAPEPIPEVPSDDFPEPLSPASESPVSDDLPDWLKGAVSSETPATEGPAPVSDVPESIGTPEPVPEVPSDETPQPAPAEALAASPEPAPASDLPDWLKGIDSAELSEEIRQEIPGTSESDVAAVSPAPSPAPSDDLPDWLKASVFPAAPSVETSEPPAAEASVRPSERSDRPDMPVKSDQIGASDRKKEERKEGRKPERSGGGDVRSPKTDSGAESKKPKPATKKTKPVGPEISGDDLPDWLKP